MVLGAVDGAMDVVVVNMKLYEKIAMVDFVARRPTFFLRTQIISPNMYLRKLKRWLALYYVEMYYVFAARACHT